MSISGVTLTIGAPKSTKVAVYADSIRPTVLETSPGKLVFSGMDASTIRLCATTYSGTTIATAGTAVTAATPSSGGEGNSVLIDTDKVLSVNAGANGWQIVEAVRSSTNTLTLGDVIAITKASGDTVLDYAVTFNSYDGFGFVVIGQGIDNDWYAESFSYYSGGDMFAYPTHPIGAIDGLLGIAEETIADTVTGTICTFGVPISSTKTGMAEEKGWYSTGNNNVPLVLRDRDGADGLYGVPLTPTELLIIPAQLGDSSWNA